MSGCVCCPACGWTEEPGDDVRSGHCPICNRPTLRRVTRWDALRDDLCKITAALVAFGLLVSLGTWLTYPYHIHGNNVHLIAPIRLSRAQISDSPTGALSTFLLRNNSKYHFKQIEVAVELHGQPIQGRGSAILGRFTRTVTDLPPFGEYQFVLKPESERGSYRVADVLGWTATVNSFELPPGYWNSRLERALTIRLEGEFPTDADNQLPIRLNGQRLTGDSIPMPFDPPSRFAPRPVRPIGVD